MPAIILERQSLPSLFFLLEYVDLVVCTFLLSQNGKYFLRYVAKVRTTPSSPLNRTKLTSPHHHRVT